jgi:hypothetical protein
MMLRETESKIMRYDLKSGLVVPDSLTLNLFLKFLNSPENNLLNPITINLEPYSNHLEEDNIESPELNNLNTKIKELNRLDLIAISDQTLSLSDFSIRVILEIKESINKLFSEIKIFDGMGFMPSIKLKDSLQIFRGDFKDYRSYLPNYLQESFDIFIGEIDNFLSQDFEIKITNFDLLSRNASEILENFENLTDRNKDLSESVFRISRSMDSFFMFQPIADDHSMNQCIIHFNLIVETFEGLVQNPNFKAIKVDIEQFERLLLLCATLIGQKC